MRKLGVVIGLVLCIWALTAASEQVLVVNPKVAIFTASPDHATVTDYVLEVYRQSDLTTLARPVTNLGKPTPNAQNDIMVTLSKTGLTNNVNYVFQIVTNSPGGSVRSATPSNPFVWVDPAAAASNLRAQ